ncbi:aspartate/glutamate racemase family protein [Dankookia sp. P2]|uniref:aspartate/glutamate racemase family protein n=1 Tax=Dankookia sp. P2 TaxID=3423955 RepID=UPI003D66C909
MRRSCCWTCRSSASRKPPSMPPPCWGGASALSPSPRRSGRCSRIAWTTTGCAPAAPASAWARPMPPTPPSSARPETAQLLALIDQSIAEDGAEAVILAGGPLAGLAALLQPSVGVPLVDGTVAAVRLAAALAGMPRPLRPRRARPLSGYGPEVSALYGK